MTSPRNLRNRCTDPAERDPGRLPAPRRHVGDFADMMRDLRGEELPAWMDRVLVDDLPALHGTL
ncbi:hypothetical protein [Streptomyces sp. MUM 16J]|uniref:hypothetical protein n=1 Tax=Streptomyces sp. MUM 16J TaxID=2791988 RepID=UPI000AFBDBDE|nr:hypothetical protein [Streptomyces sp. MUM 16J]MCH0559381.1 hypothetical protein [Streptomyces sp. MUM 16J]